MRALGKGMVPELHGSSNGCGRRRGVGRGEVRALLAALGLLGGIGYRSRRVPRRLCCRAAAMAMPRWPRFSCLKWKQPAGASARHGMRCIEEGG